MRSEEVGTTTEDQSFTELAVKGKKGQTGNLEDDKNNLGVSLGQVHRLWEEVLQRDNN